MVLSLRLAVHDASVSTLRAPKLALTLENAGPARAAVPSSQDLSGALELFTRREGRTVRRASGLTLQDMMNTGRINEAVNMIELAAGESWTRSLDLGSYQYSPPPGRYALEAVLHAGSQVVVSNSVELAVGAVEVQSVTVHRDNPVLDGSALLFGCGEPEAAFHLRQHNTTRPLGAWFSESLPLPRGSRAIVAQRSRFSTVSFDPFFERWILWQSAAQVSALEFSWGKSRGPASESELPAGFESITRACDRGDGELEVFARHPRGDLSCFRLQFGGPALLRWRIDLGARAASSALEPQVVGDAGGHHVVWLDEGIQYVHVPRGAAPTPPRRLFGSDLAPDRLELDPVARRAFAAFGARGHGQHLQIVAAPFDAPPRVFVQERPAELVGLSELGFHQTADGRLHLLANTHSGLFYQVEGGAPIRLRPPQETRSPNVLGAQRLHLGFFEPSLGYNFYQYHRGRLLPRDAEI